MLFYERNMKLLSEYQKDVFTKVQKPEFVNQFPEYMIGFGKNDKEVIDNVIINEAGKLYLAGTGQEGQAWADGINTDAHTFIIIGMGLGYHIEKLIEKYPTATIYVVEPDKRILGHALHIRDMERVIKGCKIILDETVISIKMMTFEMLTHPLARGIAVIPFFYAVYDKYINSLYYELGKMLNDWAVMLNTKRTLAKPWYINRFQNAKRESVSAKSLIGKFKDMPGILVGAGPSLQGQLEKLKRLQGKAVIIAASTAAEILTTHNITPTFMIAIDQDPITSGALHENMTGDVPLVFDGQIAQNSLQYKGKKFQMLLNVNRYTGMVIPDMPMFESGPSVANVSLDMLYKLGCSPILIIGMDMSYTDNKLYCGGTKFNKDIDPAVNMLMELPDIHGNMCRTEPSFLSMRNWYEEYVSRIKPPVFNCTAAGIPITGVENKSLDDFTFDNDYDLDTIIHDAYYKPTGEADYINLENVLKTNLELVEELNKMQSMVRQTNSITPEVSQSRAWLILDEFVSVQTYIAEIRQEYNIAKGMDKLAALKKFQDKRTSVVLEQSEELKKLLLE